MKVKIIKSSGKKRWYRNRIGDVFTVKPEVDKFYGYILDEHVNAVLDYPGLTPYCIPVEDSEIVENNTNNFPIPHNAPVLARDNGQWFPVVFDKLTESGQFRCYSHFCWGDKTAPDFIHPPEIAPMAGNEKAIHTKRDVFELWDAARVELEVLR